MGYSVDKHVLSRYYHLVCGIRLFNGSRTIRLKCGNNLKVCASQKSKFELSLSDYSMSEIGLSGNSCRFLIPSGLRLEIITGLSDEVQQIVQKIQGSFCIRFWGLG